MEYLVDVVQQLSLARTLEEVIDITRHAARELTGADGAAFVLRDNGLCYYVDEDAIGPLWKGKKFPMSACVSGWAMLNKKSVAIEDVFQDSRIPIDAYKVTFVKSLLVVPIRKDHPIGAIGNYWAKPYEATVEQRRLLEALADSTSIALENVKLFQDLKEANEFLGDSLQARDEFFSIASHELRTPISAIKLQLQMTDRKLKKQLAPSEDAEPPLKVSLQQVDKLVLLVEQLLDVSRIRLGKVDVEYQEVNFSELVEKAIEKSRFDLDQVGCKLSATIQKDVIGDADPQKVDEVISQLLSNVVKHAPGSLVEVSLHQEEDQKLILAIKDSGPGILPETQNRLFQRFERVHTPRKLGGLGLGLFITKSLVEAHRGKILLESEPDKGTKFEVVLPMKI